ncbi:uncharacterized protein B0I36DRAFT_319860 [Microdochium trichocladiopsis]|uniref:Uncharacterized protein n=1 Tax=Microdochium trichocladiopsis TaxID=1682393 RepID=A0A9P9BRG3_9PEZI|nr:uncharacterized protein B0I36DRAFT_319860 [Microdochium trichocladiopsis]KAH7032698.1 hypothetical protein B0I36DRAFT_319860 [Microdochium trichocladiopsis]
MSYRVAFVVLGVLVGFIRLGLAIEALIEFELGQELRNRHVGVDDVNVYMHVEVFACFNVAGSSLPRVALKVKMR